MSPLGFSAKLVNYFKTQRFVASFFVLQRKCHLSHHRKLAVGNIFPRVVLLETARRI